MDKIVKLDALAIAAHPDDVEISCGGLLIKLARNHKAVGVIDCTHGENGTLGSAEKRAQELLAAAQVMGLAYRGNLDLPDSGVENTIENSRKLASKIRLLRPELVILPHWEQRHPDHAAVSRLGYDACYFAGLKKLPLEGEPFRPRKIIYASYDIHNPSFLVDISTYFEDKCKAVACYGSQFGNMNMAQQVFPLKQGDVYTWMAIHAASLGDRVDVDYAESYTIKEDILIEDPLLMRVQSI